MIATDNPNLEIRYITTPEETGYTTISPALTENANYVRSRVQLGFQAPGVALWLRRTIGGSGNGSGDTLIYDLGFDVHPLEPSRNSSGVS